MEENINSEYDVINIEESNNLLYSDEQLLESNIDVIVKKIETGEVTKKEDWEYIFDNLQGDSLGEKLIDLERIIKESFSFDIEEGAIGVVYFGNATNELPIWKVVRSIVDTSHGEYGYISSTAAGILFNDEGFYQALVGFAENELGVEWDYIKDELKIDFYEGDNNSGYINFENGDSTLSVRSLNDFFSENYIDNLKCENIITIFSGDFHARGGENTYNCFFRTEFDCIMNNEIIKRINSIDKNIFYEIYNASDVLEEKVEYLT